MVRRGVLFAVCSVFMSMNSQNLLLDIGEQLFETRTWLAGKDKQNTTTVSLFLPFYVDVSLFISTY